MVAILALLLAGCGAQVGVGVERTPTPGPALEATIAAMAADNARLATQVAALSAATRDPRLGPVGEPIATPNAVSVVVTAVPVRTASPATSTLAPPPTAAPTATERPATATTAPTRAGAVAVVSSGSANLRAGPGTGYPIAGQARQGDELSLLGRTAAGDWLQVGQRDHPSWISAGLVTVIGDAGALAVVASLPPPPATLPVTPTPGATTAVAPICDMVPIRGFGQLWGSHPEVAAQLNCPSTYPQPGEVGTNASVQNFEHGLMLWLAADSQPGSDPVYALFENGEYQRFPDLGPADPAIVGQTDPGFYAVGERFSKAYWEGTGARVRQRLGRATGPQTDTAGAYQQFINGRMFWAQALTRIFVIYDYWRYPPGQPSIHIRSWASYEDTFGQ